MIIIKGIFSYPVKGCAAFHLPFATVEEGGLWANHHWLIIDGEKRMVNQKTVPKLALIKPTFSLSRLGGERPEDCGLTLNLPSFGKRLVLEEAVSEPRVTVLFRGTPLEAVDEGKETADLLSEFLGGAYRLARLVAPRDAKTGNAKRRGDDSHPFLFISRASLDDLNGRMHEAVGMDAFRPTIVLDGCAAHEEDRLDEFAIVSRAGEDVRFEGQTLCTRCNVPGVNQRTGEERPHGVGIHPFDTLRGYRNTSKGPVFGRNANHCGIGVIQEGMELKILRRREEPLDLDSMV